jgi:osmotically inducible lipoprotein OsmB
MRRTMTPVAALLGAALLLAGCGHTPGDRAASGGLIGAATGAAIGGAAGAIGGAATTGSGFSLGRPIWR